VTEAYFAVKSRVEAACTRAGRNIGEVTLLAVSKKQPLEKVRAVYDAGHRDFGENYVQEMEQRIAALPADARFHMIGHLQTNKTKRAISAAMIHGVDSEKLARAVGKAAAEAGRTVPVLLEVNVAKESSKSGVLPEAAEALVLAASAIAGLALSGLMCIPPESEGRAHFATLRALRDDLAKRTGVSLPVLSMGMSGDFEEAILEGATIVRVGTAIFGNRA
jgi:pyridoxal phosphate enzyme (YggS family)